MKVNLIKDSKVGKEIFTDVYDILTSVPGPIQFSCDNDSLVDLNDYEYLNLEEDETNKFELKKTEVVYPDMMDVIIAAHGLLREDAKRIRLDVEIDLPCPFCEENVFMVNFPLGNYPQGHCKKKGRNKGTRVKRI